jgi:S-adenosylmethionine-diacylgycerolhomoserine-N-methlytransferase
MVAFMSISSTVEDHPNVQKLAMDRMYRLQRHFYDLTRAYYLLGRDQMLEQLNLPPNGSVLEIGCGTGRNLLHVANRYPARQLFGIDISDEMLKTACAALARQGVADVRLAQADATAFDANRVLGQPQFDRVFFSYTLSMVPDWRQALQLAAQAVAPGGELHVVDFGDCAALPAFVKSALYRWLKAFHVTPRPDLAGVGSSIATVNGMTATASYSHRRYATHLRMVRSS